MEAFLESRRAHERRRPVSTHRYGRHHRYAPRRARVVYRRRWPQTRCARHRARPHQKQFCRRTLGGGPRRSRAPARAYRFSQASPARPRRRTRNRRTADNRAVPAGRNSQLRSPHQPLCRQAFRATLRADRLRRKRLADEAIIPARYRAVSVYGQCANVRSTTRWSPHRHSEIPRRRHAARPVPHRLLDTRRNSSTLRPGRHTQPELLPRRWQAATHRRHHLHGERRPAAIPDAAQPVHLGPRLRADA